MRQKFLPVVPFVAPFFSLKGDFFQLSSLYLGANIYVLWSMGKLRWVGINLEAEKAPHSASGRILKQRLLLEHLLRIRPSDGQQPALV